MRASLTNLRFVSKGPDVRLSSQGITFLKEMLGVRSANKLIIDIFFNVTFTKNIK